MFCDNSHIKQFKNVNMCEKKIFCCDTENPEYYINFYNEKFIQNNDVLYLGNRKFHKSFLIEEMNFISRYLKKRWVFIQNSVLLDDNSSFKEVIESRYDINKGLNSILCCLKAIHLSEEQNKVISECIKSLEVSVLSLESFEDKILMKFYSSQQTLNCPIYEYFHTYLDIQFYIVLIRLKCDTPKGIVEDNILKIMTDLIILSRKYFIKQFKVTITSFFCQCIKYSWLLLKLICEEHLSLDKFWKDFEHILRNDDALFSFWIIRDIISIQEIKGTSERQKLPTDLKFIKEKLKTALGESSDKLNHLRLMYPLMCDIWLSENWVEVLLLLWDHFSKRLNNSVKYHSGFHMNCVEFTELIDTIIFSPLDCDEEFEFFIGILLNYLKKQPNHWGKIKCRIFSQLSPFKIAHLEDVGLYRVLELFICLMQVNCEELSKKIISIYETIKDNVTSTNVNIYVSFIIRYTRENKNIEKITSPLVRILHHASENQNNFPIIKQFFDGFHWIIKQSNNMQLHQWTLLGTWLMKYLATCYLPDLEAAITILLFVIGKISAEDSWSHWKNVFKENVYIVLKQIGNTSSCPAKIGELVGEISCLTADVLSDAFTFFNADAIPYQVTEKFLCTILKNYPTNVFLTQLQEKIAVQSWIKICLFSTQNYEEITSNVMKLDNIPTCIKNNIKSPSDPLVTFIDILGTNKGLFVSTPVLSRFCEMCFYNLDRSLTIHLPQIKNELVILRIYTCLALALIQCGSLLYDRYKTSSPVTKLISCLLFPTEFVMGKISHPFLDAIRKTWHLYFEGLLKLGVDNDSYIHRTLRDLISKYLPHYSVVESPIYLCLNRENTANVILEKICSIYFKHPTREIEPNVTKALKILDEYVKSSTAISLLKIVVNQTFFGLCEVYIFHNQRNLALSIIMYIATCSFYDHLKEEILKSLLLLTEKHLAFNTKHYFSLIGILAKTIPSEIMILKESIIEKIKNIERIRGIGFDDNLRTHLARLSAQLHS